MVDIAVIGNNEFILGFRLAGITKIYAADSAEKVLDSVNAVLADNAIGILVMNSTDMARLPARLRQTLENSVQPTVITLGEESGGLSMRERIKRSVGVDLWK
jgi:V/A-type H+-transporting ATPase subunit F